MKKAPIAVHDLGPLQVEIMKIIWQLGQASVQQIVDAFPAGKCPAYVTILTVMRRLEARGFLAHGQEGRRFIYRPLISQETTQLSLVRDLAGRYFRDAAEFRATADRALLPA